MFRNESRLGCAAGRVKQGGSEVEACIAFWWLAEGRLSRRDAVHDSPGARLSSLSIEQPTKIARLMRDPDDPDLVGKIAKEDQIAAVGDSAQTR